MTIENPPKLWVVVPRHSFDGTVQAKGDLFATEEAAEAFVRPMWASFEPYEPVTVQAYVREDVAAEQTAAALRGEAHELDAARRERDALLAERDAVAREGWRACVLGVSIIRFWQAETKSRSGDQRGALALMNEAVALRDIFTAGDKAAGKGVG